MTRIGVVTFPGSLDDRDALRAVRIAGGEGVTLWHDDPDLHGVELHAATRPRPQRRAFTQIDAEAERNQTPARGSRRSRWRHQRTLRPGLAIEPVENSG